MWLRAFSLQFELLDTYMAHNNVLRVYVTTTQLFQDKSNRICYNKIRALVVGRAVPLQDPQTRLPVPSGVLIRKRPSWTEPYIYRILDTPHG